MPNIRRAVIRAIGILGAPSADDIKSFDAQAESNQTSQPSAASSQKQKFLDRFELHKKKEGKDHYFVYAALNALLAVANDATQSSHHNLVVNAFNIIVVPHQPQCIEMLRFIIPAFVFMIKHASSESTISTSSSQTTLADSFCERLADFIRKLNATITQFLPELLDLADDAWQENLVSPGALVTLIEGIASVLGEGLRPYLPRLLPNVFRLLTQVSTNALPSDNVSSQLLTPIFRLLDSIATSCDGFQHIVYPSLLSLVDFASISLPTRQAGLRTLIRLTAAVDVWDQVSVMLHTIVHVLDTTPELRSLSMELLVLLIHKIGSSYVRSGFHGLVNDVLHKHRIQHSSYEKLMRCFATGDPFPDYTPPTIQNSKQIEMSPSSLSLSSSGNMTTHSAQALVNSAAVRIAAEAPLLANTADSGDQPWAEWLKHFGLVLIQECPAIAIRSCAKLAEKHAPVSRELFNAAFVACWTDLYEEDQDSILKTFEAVLHGASYETNEIAQAILGLAEFMDGMHKGRLPLDETLLATAAYNAKTYAKALYYERKHIYELMIEGNEEGMAMLKWKKGGIVKSSRVEHSHPHQRKASRFAQSDSAAGTLVRGRKSQVKIEPLPLTLASSPTELSTLDTFRVGYLDSHFCIALAFLVCVNFQLK